MDPAIIFFGLAVGALVGMTGMGGGALMTPILILFFGVKPVTAIGTDLAWGAVTKTVGGYRHWKKGGVDFKLSTWMGIGSVPSALAGVIFLQFMAKSLGHGFEDLVLVAVAAALTLTALAVLVRVLVFPHMSDTERVEFRGSPRDKAAALTVGIVVGFVLGVTSAGSGGLIAVALILIFRMVPNRVVGTDVFHAAILLWAASLAHLVAGNIDFLLAGNILLGSIPGVILGTHYMSKVPVATLRMILAVVLIGSALGLLTKAGASIPAPVLAGIPILVLAIVVAAVKKPKPRRPAPPEPLLAAQQAGV